MSYETFNVIIIKITFHGPIEELEEQVKVEPQLAATMLTLNKHQPKQKYFVLFSFLRNSQKIRPTMLIECFVKVKET